MFIALRGKSLIQCLRHPHSSFWKEQEKAFIQHAADTVYTNPLYPGFVWKGVSLSYDDACARFWCNLVHCRLHMWSAILREVSDRTFCLSVCLSVCAPGLRTLSRRGQGSAREKHSAPIHDRIQGPSPTLQARRALRARKNLFAEGAFRARRAPRTPFAAKPQTRFCAALGCT